MKNVCWEVEKIDDCGNCYTDAVFDKLKYAREHKKYMDKYNEQFSRPHAHYNVIRVERKIVI